MKTKALQAFYIKCTPKKWTRSKWGKGVQEYALELLEKLTEHHENTNSALLKSQILNGATSWTNYSEGGCSLIYNEDIAQRLATKSEIKRRTHKDGQLDSYANKDEQWLDVQARALFQAYRRIKETLISYETL